MSRTLETLGIMLNLIAGFLLAPQLIGLARLERAEGWTTDKLEASRKKFEYRRRTGILANRFIGEGFFPTLWMMLRLIGHSLIASIPPALMVWLLTWLLSQVGVPAPIGVAIGFVAFFVLPSAVVIWTIHRGSVEGDQAGCAIAMYAPLAVLLTALVGIPLEPVVDGSLRALHAIASALVTRIRDHDGIVGLMTTAGVGCFVLGNGAQLVAIWAV